MTRVLTYKIEQETDEILVKYFLKSRGYPSRVISLLKRIYNGITINGAHAYATNRLKIGDVLVIKVEDELPSENIPPVKMDLDIVYEDDDLMVINKSAGVASHPSSLHFGNSLASGVMYYFSDEKFVYRCANRLDKNTSGLLIIAKNRLASALLVEMVKKKDIKRKYLAVVSGDFPYDKGEIVAPIGRSKTSILERCVDFEAGLYAKTNYDKIMCKNGHSLIALQLETGRTHQIRVHLKHIGYPIIGDFLYNPDYDNISRQALHSHKLEFFHPITGEFMEITSPMPKDMAKIFEKE